MPNDQTFTIDFKAGAGSEKLIKTIERLGVAQNKLEAGFKKIDPALSKVHGQFSNINPTIQRMNARLTVAGKSWKDLGVSLNLVNKASKGCVVSMEQLRVAMNKGTAAGIFAVRNNRLLSNSFATLRSHLLLYAFGAMLVERAVVSMVRAFGQQEAANEKLRVGLGNVADTTEGVTQRLIDYSSALQQSTAFGDEMITTGMVQFTTFGLNEQAIKSLTPQVLNVARAIQTVSGQMPDLNSLFIAFGKATTTGIGTLTRYGVVLTAAERAQLELLDANESAVMIADILAKQYGGIAEAHAKTTAGILESTSAAISDATEAVGEAFAPMVKEVAGWIKDFAESLDAGDIRRWIDSIKLAALAVGAFKGAMWAARAATIGFNLAMASTPWGLLLALGGLAVSQILKLTGAYGGSKDAIEDAAKATEKAKDIDYELLEAQDKGAESLKHRLALLQAASPVEKILIGLKHEASDAERELAQQIVETIHQNDLAKQAEKDRAKAYRDSASDFKKALNEINNEIKKEQDAYDRLFPSTEKYQKGMEDSRLSHVHMQNELKKYIEWLDKEGKKHNLVTDAMKANEEEQEKLTASKNAAIEVTKNYNAHMDRLWVAVDKLKIVEMERKALLDGTVTTEERLAIITEEWAQATALLDKATKEGDPVGRLAAETELLRLMKERLGLIPEEKDLAKSYIDQLAIMQETNPVRKEMLRLAQEEGTNIFSLKLMYPELESAIAHVLIEKRKLQEETLELTKKLNAELGVVEGLGIAFNTLTSSIGGLDFSALDKLAEAEKKSLADPENLDALIALQETQIETKKAFYSQMGEMTANFIAEEAARNEAAIRSRLSRELAALREENRYKLASDKRKKEMEDDVKAKHQKDLTRQFRIQQQASIASIWMSAISASMKSVEGSWVTIGQPWFGLIMGLAAAQSALVMSQKPPKAQQGGLIGGRRHSQGGTMIEAEQGEFIMNRNAVQSVGIENMNRINEGGGASNVTVNVSGNVLSQDFVEGELAENIKEAIRRGTDFGIS